MARRSTKPGAAWTAGLAAQVEALGAELGRIIAEQVRRQVESEIDVSALAQGLLEGARGGKRGRRGLPERAVCKVAGCGRPLLAKGFCRSHYYRERYRAQRASDARGKGKAGSR